MGRYDEVTRIKAGEYEVYGGHARRDDYGTSTCLELCERVGEDVARRIARACVIVTSRPSEALEGIAARQVDMRYDGPERTVRGDAVRGGGRLGRFGLGHELCTLAGDGHRGGRDHPQGAAVYKSRPVGSVEVGDPGRRARRASFASPRNASQPSTCIGRPYAAPTGGTASNAQAVGLRTGMLGATARM